MTYLCACHTPAVCLKRLIYTRLLHVKNNVANVGGDALCQVTCSKMWISVSEINVSSFICLFYCLCDSLIDSNSMEAMEVAAVKRHAILYEDGPNEVSHTWLVISHVTQPCACVAVYAV